MKEYTLTEEEIRGLKRCLDPDMGHSAFWIINEVTTNILPELFENPFEVGRYYRTVDKHSNLYFKCTETRNDKVIGYGLDNFEGSEFIKDDFPWVRVNETDEVEEITREEFLEQIKKYAVEELGFKGGVNIHWEDVDMNYHNLKGDIEIDNDEEILYIGGIIIYEDGIFAKIVDEPKKKYDKVVVNFEEKTFQNLIEVFKTTKQAENIDFSETTKVEINRV